MNKKLIWVLVGIAAVIILLVGLKKAGVIGKETGEEVTSEKVQLRTITESVNASGKIYPEIEVKVSPDISGEIVNLFVEEGDKVTKGQVLAKIYADIPEQNVCQATVASQAINFTPRPGQLMFINSWLPHSFGKNPSEETFRFIHFNISLGYNLDYQPPAITEATVI